MHKKGKYFLFLFPISLGCILFSLIGYAMESSSTTMNGGKKEEESFRLAPYTIPPPPAPPILDAGEIKRQSEQINLVKLPEDVQRFVASFQKIACSMDQSPPKHLDFHRGTLSGLLQDIEERLRPHFGLKWDETSREWEIDEAFHQKWADRFRRLADAVGEEENFYTELQPQY